MSFQTVVFGIQHSATHATGNTDALGNAECTEQDGKRTAGGVLQVGDGADDDGGGDAVRGHNILLLVQQRADDAGVVRLDGQDACKQGGCRSF